MTAARTVIACAVLATAAAAGGYFLGRHAASGEVAPSTTGTAPGDRKVLYWHDPMVPGQRFDKPGKSPFMDMQLVPVYADEAGGDAGVRIAPTVQQNLGLRTATVRRADVASSFDAVGTVAFDERLSVAVQSRVAGYIEHLAVRAPMEQVRPGQPLATVFAPDWLGPQNELLALERSGAPQDLVDAARDRLRAMSIPESLMRQSESRGVAQARFALVAPVGGVVAELGVREGVAVAPGTTLFRINGLARVWAIAEVPEAQAVGLTRGQKVRAVLQADAGRAFDGELTEILPQINAGTRTLQARFEVDNKAGQLVPGMLLRLHVAGPTTVRLVVPAEAVIRTGVRTVVIVRRADGSFDPREVRIGVDSGDSVEVVEGLAEGEQVVASGQFLIDSEARLKSVLGAMAPAVPVDKAAAASAASAAGPAADVATAAVVHVGQGKVESVDTDAVTISHGPIASLKWPAMTMGFAKATPSAFAAVKPGDTVRFEFRSDGAGGYRLVSLQRTSVQRDGGARP